MKPILRRKARRIAVQALYQWQVTGDPVSTIELQYVTDNNPEEVDMSYFRDLFGGVISRIDELDEKIGALVSRPFKDVDLLDKAILRLGAYELLYRNDTPYRVIINEAIEVTKAFGSEQSPKFINGVLDAIAKDK